MMILEADKLVNNVLLLFVLSNSGWLHCLQIVVLTSAGAKKSLVVEDLSEVQLLDKKMDPSFLLTRAQFEQGKDQEELLQIRLMNSAKQAGRVSVGLKTEYEPIKHRFVHTL